jgi:hypothetical protein
MAADGNRGRNRHHEQNLHVVGCRVPTGGATMDEMMTPSIAAAAMWWRLIPPSATLVLAVKTVPQQSINHTWRKHGCATEDEPQSTSARAEVPTTLLIFMTERFGQY